MSSGAVVGNECKYLTEVNGNGGNVTFADITGYKFLYITHSMSDNFSAVRLLIPVSIIELGFNDFMDYYYEDSTYNAKLRASLVTKTSASISARYNGWGGITKLYAIP